MAAIIVTSKVQCQYCGHTQFVAKVHSQSHKRQSANTTKLKSDSTSSCSEAGEEPRNMRELNITPESRTMRRRTALSPQSSDGSKSSGSRGSSASSGAYDLPPVDFCLNLPFSGRSTGVAFTDSEQRQARKQEQHPQLRSTFPSPSFQQAKELSSEQQKRVRECFWLIESVLAIHFKLDSIVDQVQTVEGNGGVIELCEDGQVKGIYIVDEGELEIVTNDGSVVVNSLKPGDFCGELAALFKVQQDIKTKSQDRFVEKH